MPRINFEKHVDTIYLNDLERILNDGVPMRDRTGVGTLSTFGSQQRYDLKEGFPALTTKKLYFRAIIEELIFFLTGRTDNNWLKERKVNIWNEWADEDGDLGPIYGFQWRHFGAEYIPQYRRDAGEKADGFDQISKILQDLKENPFSRRHILSAWNPAAVDQMALPPCHTLFQFYVHPDKNGAPLALSGQLYQRSKDSFLGSPFNIASYSILIQLFADLVGLKPQEFVHTTGDAHIYTNHIEQVKLQLSRRNDLFPMPTLKIHHPFDLSTVDLSDPEIFNLYSFENFEVVGYQSHPKIEAPIAV